MLYQSIENVFPEAVINVLNSKTEKELVSNLGRAYIENKFESENSTNVEKAYKEIAKVNKELFKRIPFEVVFTSEDTYESARVMRERVIKENKIYIYNQYCEHPFFSVEENLQFRAVHDVFAHMVCGCPFTFKGEFNAYLEQRKYYPEWTWGVLFSEIPMQTSAYYYSGGFDFPQRAIDVSDYLVNYYESRFTYDYSEHSVMDSLLVLK